MLNLNNKLAALLVGAIAVAVLGCYDLTEAKFERQTPDEYVGGVKPEGQIIVPENWQNPLFAPAPLEFGHSTNPEDERILETVYLPADYNSANSYPLVVFLHGYGWEDATDLVENIYELTEWVDEMEFILLVPQGLKDEEGNAFWSANQTCCDYYGLGQDDHAYLEGLITEYRDAYSIDPNRIYMYGSSNGAFMAHAFACEHAELVSGIVAISGVDELELTDCEPSRPISVLEIHGTDDDAVWYAGHPDDEVPPPLLRGYPGALESTAHWAARNGCSLLPSIIGTLDLDWLISGSETTRFAWSCPNKKIEVEHWAVEGGTHTFYVWDIGIVETDGFAEQTLGWLLAQSR